MTTLAEKIAAFSVEGYPKAEIARKLGCSESTVRYYCNPADKERRQRRDKERNELKAKYIQDYKQSSGCIDCGNMYPYWMLDLDHVRGEKIANLSKMSRGGTYSLQQIVDEIAKCDVVCANCHRDRTWKRSQLTQE